MAGPASSTNDSSAPTTSTRYMAPAIHLPNACSRPSSPNRSPHAPLFASASCTASRSRATRSRGGGSASTGLLGTLQGTLQGTLLGTLLPLMACSLGGAGCMLPRSMLDARPLKFGSHEMRSSWCPMLPESTVGSDVADIDPDKARSP